MLVQYVDRLGVSIAIIWKVSVPVDFYFCELSCTVTINIDALFSQHYVNLMASTHYQSP